MENPKHPRARTYLQVFDGLTSFRELEDRITGLLTENERGDAFEVFAEAYFATQHLVQAKTVWPFYTIPIHIKERLSLGTGREMGVDGIFETHLGQFNAYQAKFRSGRPSLNWTELSTFMGLTDQVEQRVVITNCNDLSQVMNERSGFYCIRGSDLDRLDPRDFEAILGWLKSTAVEEKRKEPLPHQQIALSEVLATLKEHDRATVLMPCGSGKTLLTLWVAEQLNCRKVLVLVPSLALLRQTLHEWLKETRWKKRIYLCVCSDPTLVNNRDELVIRQSDVDFPVTTDSTTVIKFLETKAEGVKVVFSTYQSAWVVSKGMAESETFELCIFDEAHKTAGKEGMNFSFALKDENLTISKRLFLTATPRHYDVKKRDKEGDAKLVYSMDVPGVYGPIAYQLSFAKAVQREIICDFKVVISVVTSKMVNDEVLRRGEVEVGGDLVRPHQVANQIALKSAVDKFGINKIITFHKTVASATSFTGKGGQGVQKHLPEFDAFHVNGEMPTAKRDSLMTSFREANHAVISNARCLTEGVDVPVVDMVAFMSPKRSRIDIVQATGRAMRKSEATDKVAGYVLVPLFVEQEARETVEEAVARTEFDDVWQVLQALQEQDEVLAETIRQIREDRGHSKGFDDRAFREKVIVLGPDLSLDTLRKVITTRIIDKIGSSWDERFGELKAYKGCYGHCNVPRDWSQNPQLATWVPNQRRVFSKGQLMDDRVRRLNKIGFLWNLNDAFWEERFAELVAFKKTHGHCNVPQGWSQNPQLATWVPTQRILFSKGQLTDDKIRRLNEIGFVWNRFDTVWEERFAELVSFIKTHGHCNVPTRWSENPQLGNWVLTQRHVFSKGQLMDDRVRRLNEIGFVWTIIKLKDSK